MVGAYTALRKKSSKSNHDLQYDKSGMIFIILKNLNQFDWQAKSGVEVESTEIALAFPLRPGGQKKDSKVTCPYPLHNIIIRS